jgi:hypothetical protein
MSIRQVIGELVDLAADGISTKDWRAGLNTIASEYPGVFKGKKTEVRDIPSATLNNTKALKAKLEEILDSMPPPTNQELALVKKRVERVEEPQPKAKPVESEEEEEEEEEPKATKEVARKEVATKVATKEVARKEVVVTKPSTSLVGTIKEQIKQLCELLNKCDRYGASFWSVREEKLKSRTKYVLMQDSKDFIKSIAARKSSQFNKNTDLDPTVDEAIENMAKHFGFDYQYLDNLIRQTEKVLKKERANMHRTMAVV